MEKLKKNQKNPIKLYMHCKSCLSGQLAIGWTEKGFAIWCEKCDKKVAHYDLQGHKVVSI